MTQANIQRRNQLIQRLGEGKTIEREDRGWLASHPIISVRYGFPWILADFLPMEPGEAYVVTVQCQKEDPDYPVVPTFTLPFEQGGYIQLAHIAHSQTAVKDMKQSTKLSLRMITGITASARCKSDTGLLMVSYQEWVRNNKPIPMWFESIRHPAFAMEKEMLSDNMICYRCRGDDEREGVFEFLVNWYPLNEDKK